MKRSLVLSLLLTLAVGLLPGATLAASSKEAEAAAREALGTFSETIQKQLGGSKEGEIAACTKRLAEDDILGQYFKHAVSGRRDEAQKQLFDLYQYFNCISAKRFASEFGVILEGYEEVVTGVKDPQARQLVDQAMTAPFFLMYDIGGPVFRLELSEWFEDRRDEWERLVGDPESLVSRTGLVAAKEGGLFQLTSPEVIAVLRFFASMGGSACQFRDLVIIEPREGDLNGDMRVFCPGDCVQEKLQRAEDAGLQAGIAITELDDTACGDIRDRIKEIPLGTQGRLRQCIDQFNESQPWLACVMPDVDPLHRLAPQLGVRVQVSRQCTLTQGADGQSADGQSADDQLDAAINAWIITNKIRAEEKAEAARQTSVAETYREAARIYSGAADAAAERGDRAHASTWRRLARDATRSARRAERLAAQHMERARNAQRRSQRHVNTMEQIVKARQKSRRFCAPEFGTCPDDCSIVSKRIQETSACLEKQWDPRPVPGRGPDPEVTMPRPDQNPTLPAAIDGLAQCIRQALAPENETVDQTSCKAILRCPNMEEPRGENCTCLPEQKVTESLKRCNDEVALCPGADIPCSCGPRGPLPASAFGEISCPAPGTSPVNPVARLAQRMEGKASEMPPLMRGVTDACVRIGPVNPVDQALQSR